MKYALKHFAYTISFVIFLAACSTVDVLEGEPAEPGESAEVQEPISSELFDAIAAWQGSDSEKLASYLAETSPETLEEWARMLRSEVPQADFRAFLQNANADEGGVPEEISLNQLALTRPDLIAGWVAIELGSPDLTLESWLPNRDPKAYQTWLDVAAIPGRTMDLSEYLSKIDPQLLEEAQARGVVGSVDLTTQASPCRCRLIFTLDRTNNSTERRVVGNTNTNQWYKVSNYGAANHIEMEEKVGGGGKAGAIASVPESGSSIKAQMICRDSQGTDCNGCKARLHNYAFYSADYKAQAASGKTFLGDGHAARVAVTDAIKLSINVDGHEEDEIDKAVALALVTGGSFDYVKAIQLIASVAGTVAGFSDLSDITKLEDTDVTELKGIVKSKGNHKTEFLRMNVAYDSVSGSAEKRYLEANTVATSTLLSSSAITVSGWGRWNGTDGSYMGAGSTLAVAADQIECVRDATFDRSFPVGGWLNQTNYEAPPSLSLPTKVRNFFAQALGGKSYTSSRPISRDSGLITLR